MLARLEALEDVDHAQVDFSGDLLKLSMRSEHALEPAIALLNELGYGAESASDAESPSAFGMTRRRSEIYREWKRA